MSGDICQAIVAGNLGADSKIKSLGGRLKKIAIIQSNYIPWRGYFDLIAAADELIIYDDVQYTRRDWRNRNQIKTRDGLLWLTVPVQTKGLYHQKIRDTVIDGAQWAPAHWRTLESNYRRASHFAEVAAWLEPIYLREEHHSLSALNRRLLEAICSYLGIATRLTNSWDYELIDGKTERLAHLCRQANATEYISGPSAKSYIDEAVFHAMGIGLTWFDYQGYKDYPQLWGQFEPAVSVVDLLFNMGPSAPDLLRYCRR